MEISSKHIEFLLAKATHLNNEMLKIDKKDLIDEDIQNLENIIKEIEYVISYLTNLLLDKKDQNKEIFSTMKKSDFIIYAEEFMENLAQDLEVA